MIRILAIRVIDRIKESGHTQEVLTAHSDMILTRLGFHELNELICSREGFIVLRLRDDINGYNRLIEDLNRIFGIERKELILCEEADNNDYLPEDTRISIAVVKIKDKSDVVLEVQKLLTLFGCSIRTRMGVNLESEDSQSGLIILELAGDITEINRLAERLYALEGACAGMLWFQ